MSEGLLVLLLASEAVSLFLIWRLWKREGPPVIKIVLSLLAAVPIVGPVLFLFVSDSTPPQPLDKQNRLPRGYYTHERIIMGELEEKFRAENEQNEHEDKSETQ